MLTLTFRATSLVGEGETRADGFRKARRAVDAFWTSYRRETGDDPRRVAFLEVTEGTGLPHFHILVDRRMDATACWRIWPRVGGGWTCRFGSGDPPGLWATLVRGCGPTACHGVCGESGLVGV
jgi:hypothetical protein